jgi:DNA primase
MLGAGIAVRVAVMPPPHDPDSFIKENGGEAFRAMIQKAEGFFDYYLKRLCDAEDIATDRGRLAVLRNMSEALHKTGNQVLIDAYAQKTAMQLGVEPRAVRAEFAKVTRKQPVERESREEEMPVEPEEEVAPPSQLEHWLLRLMFINDDLVPWAASRLDPRWIQHAAVQQAVSRRIELHTAGTWSSLPAFLTSEESPEVASLVTEVIAESRPIPNQEQQVKDIVLRLRNQFIDQQMTLLRSKANHPETPEQEALEILRKQQELRDLKRTPVE